MRLISVLIGLLFMSACTYHGQLRRGIYRQPAQDLRQSASVLVVSDRFIPSQISFTEPDTSSLKAYQVETMDGVAVAVADALGTRFERVDAGSYTLAAQYDLVAEVSYQAGLTRSNCEEDASSLSVRTNGLCTRLEITLRNSADKTPLVKTAARRWEEFLTPGFPAGVQWLNKHTFSILFPILDPLYVQTQGIHVRRTLERQLKDALQDILQQLDEKLEKLSSEKGE